MIYRAWGFPINSKKVIKDVFQNVFTDSSQRVQNKGRVARSIVLTSAITLLTACSGGGPQFYTIADSFTCETPRQQGDWSRLDQRDSIGQWHEFINGDGKRFRSARLTHREVQGTMSNFFSGDAGSLVSAFDNLRLMLGDEVSQLNLVEMEFGTKSQSPEAILVVDAQVGDVQGRRGIMIRRGEGHYDLLQLRGAGDDAAVIKAQLRAFSSRCSPIL